jgi:hypothetical protein
MIVALTEIFLIAFFLNLLYELLHSPLYETCLKMPLKKYVPLIIRASFYDAVWIVVIYSITYLSFGNKNIFNDYLRIGLFSIISTLFAYSWELYSIKNKRWEYSPKMPLIFGAGLTPTFQIFLTGLVSLYAFFLVK